MTDMSPSPGAPDRGARPSSPSRGGYRRAFWISMGVSALIHLLAVALYPALFLRMPEGTLVPGGPSQDVTPRGTELLNLQELSQAEFEALPPEEEPEPEEPREEVQASPTAGRVAEEAPGEAEAAEGAPRTNAELLRPQAGDLRLWAPPDPDVVQPSEEELMKLYLLWELEELADSSARAEELARRAMDWTYTDDEGRRWGVSPGKLHLGDLTLPLPFGFSAPPGMRDRIQGRTWEWDDIQRGAGAAAIQESWKERNEAIRRRKEAERKPDTTGVRR